MEIRLGKLLWYGPQLRPLTHATCIVRHSSVTPFFFKCVNRRSCFDEAVTGYVFCLCDLDFTALHSYHKEDELVCNCFGLFHRHFLKSNSWRWSVKYFQASMIECNAGLYSKELINISSIKHSLGRCGAHGSMEIWLLLKVTAVAAVCKSQSHGQFSSDDRLVDCRPIVRISRLLGFKGNETLRVCWPWWMLF